MRRSLVPLLFAACLLLPMPCAHPAEVRSSAIETTYVAVFRPHALADSPVKITGELKVAVYKIVSLSVDGDTTGAAFIWDVTPEDVADPRDRGKDFDFTGPPGTYHVKLRVIQTKDGKFTINTARVTVVIGEPGPRPTPPVPPGPGPTPTPPDPPSPVPIPFPGFRVLIIEETSQRGKLPINQQLVIFDKDIRAYLNAKCVVGADGKLKEWRIWDKDAVTAAEPKLWQDAMKRPRASVPWIIISDGKTGFEGPLPANVADTMKLLKKYGGD